VLWKHILATMRHPEVFLVPFVMLLDYLLTVAGSRLAARKYSQHFKFEHYELNPVWQKTITQGRWFSPKHMGIVVVTSLCCLVWGDAWKEPSQISEGALGFFVILYSSVVASHLGNILTFWRVLRHPQDLSGEVTVSHKQVLAMSRHRSLMVIFPIALAVWLAPSPFLYGGLASLILLDVYSLVWSFNYPSQAKQKAT